MLGTLKESLKNSGGNILLAALCFALILVMILNYNTRLDRKMDREEFMAYIAMSDKRDIETNVMLDRRLCNIEESLKEIERVHRINRNER
jgi:hypothetical protein